MEKWLDGEDATTEQQSSFGVSPKQKSWEYWTRTGSAGEMIRFREFNHHWVLWPSQLLTGHLVNVQQKDVGLTRNPRELDCVVRPAQLGSEFGFISFRLTGGQKLNRDEGYRTSSITASTKELTALLSPVRCLSSGRLSQSKTFWPWLYIKWNSTNTDWKSEKLENI